MKCFESPFFLWITMWAFYCNNSSVVESLTKTLWWHLSHIYHAECEETFVTQVFPAPVSSCANLRDGVCCTSSCEFRQFHSMSNYCYSTSPKGEPPLRPGSILLTANAVWWLDQTASAHNQSKPLQLNLNGWLKKSSEMVVILYWFMVKKR